ncbi:MAG: hypothetical protein KatS3mg009_2560 [Acidimicrobiia bacterium]|nr:MAG: hypothetical protein KatS3mg009_2560 [Acidimicrobiia bacterium]
MRRHSSQVSTVPKARSAVGGDAALAQQPRELRRGEVRVEHEAGAGPHQRLVAGGRERVAGLGGAAVLPHDRAVARAPGPPVPHDRRLALVRDADRRDRPAGVPAPPRHLVEGLERDPPDVLGVVLHPPGPGEVLGELAVGRRPRRAAGVDGDRPDAGRPRVDRDHTGHRTSSPSSRASLRGPLRTPGPRRRARRRAGPVARADVRRQGRQQAGEGGAAPAREVEPQRPAGERADAHGAVRVPADRLHRRSGRGGRAAPAGGAGGTGTRPTSSAGPGR